MGGPRLPPGWEFWDPEDQEELLREIRKLQAKRQSAQIRPWRLSARPKQLPRRPATPRNRLTRVQVRLPGT